METWDLTVLTKLVALPPKYSTTSPLAISAVYEHRDIIIDGIKGIDQIISGDNGKDGWNRTIFIPQQKTVIAFRLIAEDKSHRDPSVESLEANFEQILDSTALKNSFGLSDIEIDPSSDIGQSAECFKPVPR